MKNLQQEISSQLNTNCLLLYNFLVLTQRIPHFQTPVGSEKSRSRQELRQPNSGHLLKSSASDNCCHTTDVYGPTVKLKLIASDNGNSSGCLGYVLADTFYFCFPCPTSCVFISFLHDFFSFSIRRGGKHLKRCFVVKSHLGKGIGACEFGHHVTVNRFGW